MAGKTWAAIALFWAAAMTASGVVLAHHGWGSYDAANPITISGLIVTSEYQNPHVVLNVEANGKRWIIVLAPVSRMLNRGALAELMAVGKTISAFGYVSTVEKNELRAERVTVDGKTIEMR
ncbi:MAG: hypothetical protein FJX68_00740 [Alphaproteobacteria bacterium]|nr:hypothetical protein [Alphaproteobacteria bacterium]